MKLITLFTLLFSFIAVTPSWAREIPVDVLIPKYTDSSSKFVKVEGLNFHVRDKGRGETIVLLHGILSSLQTWEGWVPKLSQKYRVISIDLPGHGLTGPDPKNKYSIDRITFILNKLVTKLGIKKFHLVGNSLGGWIAWEYAARFPRDVSKLVLIDAAGFDVRDVPWVIRFARLPIAHYALSGNAPWIAVKLLLESVYGYPLRITEKTVTRYHELFLREGNGKAFHRMAHTRLEDHSELLRKIKIPTLIIWGLRDRWISPRYADDFHHALENSEVVNFDDLGHIPMEEEPVRTLQATLPFLEKEKAP